MTLCMAALAYDKDTKQRKLVVACDWRAEVDWAGGDVAFKMSWGKRNWPALIAGGISAAHDLLATCRSVLAPDSEAITEDNILDKFYGVSNTHKEKLCRRLVAQRLGIDYERFLTHGEDELPPDVRSRLFHEISNMDFGCEVLICGFIGGAPCIVEISGYGDVVRHQNFAAIGTGSIIAKSTLYQREHIDFTSVERTIYHMYEAATLAHASAPGVGRIREYIALWPNADGSDLEAEETSQKGLDIMQKTFEEIGPKPMIPIPMLDVDCWLKMSPSTNATELAK